MFKFSRKVEYALTAMVVMSQTPIGELVTARELAENYQLSPELIGKILQTLARNNLAESVQGVKGGYYLHRTANTIFISEIITAIDGPISLVNCGQDTTGCECERKPTCVIRRPMLNIQMKLINFFKTMTLNDFRGKYSSTDLN